MAGQPAFQTLHPGTTEDETRALEHGKHCAAKDETRGNEGKLKGKMRNGRRRQGAPTDDGETLPAPASQNVQAAQQIVSYI